MNATCIGSPSYPASIASLARASSLPPASTTRPSSLNDSRIGVVRSATSATRRTTSTSVATGIRACALWWSGSRLRTLGKSPSSSRLVVRRAPPTNPIMPSPIPPRASATVTSPPSGPRVFAVSARIFAGTSACRLASGVSGCHGSSLMANRYRSVASRVISAPSSSTRTPVSSGSVSSRPAATATCDTAAANTPASTVPAVAGISGSVG